MASFRLLPYCARWRAAHRTVDAGGDDLRAALDDLTEQHPALRSRLFDDDGEIASFVNVYVEGEDVRVSGGLDTPLSADANVMVLRPWPVAVEAQPSTTHRRARCSSAGRSAGTPLVELTKLAPSPEVRLFAKLEWFDPTGSVKDRVACAMLDAAAEAGELWPGRRVLSPRAATRASRSPCRAACAASVSRS